MEGLVLWAVVLGACAATTLVLSAVMRRSSFQMLQILTPGSRVRPRVCPHLGLASDPFVRGDAPTDEHRCYAHMLRERIDVAHQQRFCLTASHNHCPFLLVKPAGSPSWHERLRGQAVAYAFSISQELLRRGDALANEAWARRGELVPLARRGIVWTLPHLWTATLVLSRWAIRGARIGVTLLVTALMWLWEHRSGIDQGYERAVRSTSAHGARVRRAIRLPDVSWAWQALASSSVAVYQRIGAQRRLATPVVDLAATMPAEVRTFEPESAEPLEHSSTTEAAPPIHELPVVMAAEVAPIAAAAQAASVEPAAGATFIPIAAMSPSFAVGTATGQSVAPEVDFLARGIAAVEAGLEEDAYPLFKQAVTVNPRSERAWFWRAKTAQTLDEVIDCLDRALALNPANATVRANLEWAQQRREREALTAEASKSHGRSEPAVRLFGDTPRPRRAAMAILSTFQGLVRAAGACAALALGAGWIGGGLPSKLRGVLDATNADLLALLPIVDVSPLQNYARLELVPGYNVLSAVPFILGFLALMVASGLLNRESWARLWGPLVALVSVWLWLGVLGATPTSLALAMCGIVAVAGLVGPSREFAT